MTNRASAKQTNMSVSNLCLTHQNGTKATLLCLLLHTDGRMHTITGHYT